MFKKIIIALLSKLATSHETEINKAQKWIDNAQYQFTSAIEEAKVAEEKFDKIIADAKAKAEELQATIDNALIRKEEAIKIKEKFTRFINE